jgi:hypothetical protein
MLLRKSGRRDRAIETKADVGLLALLIWLLPIVLILKSDKTNGTEKPFWLVAVLFVSWLAPLGEKRRS